MKKCEVCGSEEPTRIAASVTGPVSFQYCDECLRGGREPYGAVVVSLFGMACMDDVAQWYEPTIEATLQAEGKSWKELFADVDAATREYLGRSTEDTERPCLARGLPS